MSEQHEEGTARELAEKARGYILLNGSAYAGFLADKFAGDIAAHDALIVGAAMEQVIDILEMSPTFHKHTTAGTLCHCEVCAYVRGNVTEIRARLISEASKTALAELESYAREQLDKRMENAGECGQLRFKIAKLESTITELGERIEALIAHVETKTPCGEHYSILISELKAVLQKVRG